MGLFPNYGVLDEIKWLCAFTENAAQKFITKPQSMAMT